MEEADLVNIKENIIHDFHTMHAYMSLHFSLYPFATSRISSFVLSEIR